MYGKSMHVDNEITEKQPLDSCTGPNIRSETPESGLPLHLLMKVTFRFMGDLNVFKCIDACDATVPGKLRCYSRPRLVYYLY